MLSFQGPTKAERELFVKNGVVSLRGVFDDIWVNRLQNQVDEYIVAAEKSVQSDSKPSRSFFVKSDLWEKDSLFKDAIFKSALGKIAADLLNSDRINIFEDTILVKEPCSDTETPWHQDLPYYPINGQKVCTIWLALDIVTKENGACRFIKKSHKWGKWYNPVSFNENRKFEVDEFEPIENALEHLNERDIISFDLQPGDCSVHHGLTIHGAYKNISLIKRRRAIAWSFIGDDCVFATRQFQEKFGKKINLKPGDAFSGNRFPIIWRKETGL